MSALEEVPVGYRALTCGELDAYVRSVKAAADHLGLKDGDEGVDAVEIGDGNLNLVFFVTHRGNGRRVVVKQALPYVRCIGDSWPLPLSRAYFEQLALKHENAAAPGFAPLVLHYDPTLATIVMELLSPHIILRKGLIAGIEYPKLAVDVGTFLAQSLFRTSDLGMLSAAKKKVAADFLLNSAMCDLTHGVIFTDPFVGSPHNRHTPELDAHVATLQGDAELRIAAAFLKRKFMTSEEALIHADLHTGSIMVTQEETRIIDPEFAFYGPMGFDVGAFVANILLSFFSHGSPTSKSKSPKEYRSWLLHVVETTWTTFQSEFERLWNSEHKGELFSPSYFPCDESFSRAKSEYFSNVLSDSVQFAGIKMIRRILGVAHVEDLESIEDTKARAACELAALKLAREMLVHPENFPSIEVLIKRASEFI